jgi:hypothetical protein
MGWGECYRVSELSFFLKERGYIGQDNCTAATSLIVGFTQERQKERTVSCLLVNFGINPIFPRDAQRVRLTVWITHLMTWLSTPHRHAASRQTSDFTSVKLVKSLSRKSSSLLVKQEERDGERTER